MRDELRKWWEAENVRISTLSLTDDHPPPGHLVPVVRLRGKNMAVFAPYTCPEHSLWYCIECAPQDPPGLFSRFLKWWRER